MNVLAFSDYSLDESDGGVERAIWEIYSRLSGRHQIRLITLAEIGSAQGRSRIADGFEVIRCRRVPLERITGIQTALSFSIWPTALRESRSFRPDVIHAHTLFFHSTLTATAVATLTGTPLVTTVHVGSMNLLPQPQRAAVKLYEGSVGRVVLARSRRVIAVSRDVATHVESLGVTSRKCTVVPNGVDIERFRPATTAEGSPLIIFVGRLILNKGPHVLVSALDLLHKNHTTFRAMVVGDGPMRSVLEQQVRLAGMSAQVEFLGSREDVPELMRQASIFVRPSFTEGMSLAVLEAMASGLACVVSDVSGNAELVTDGESGWVVPPGDSVALARRLTDLLDDPELRQRFADSARRKSTSYSWDTCAEKTSDVLTIAAARGRAM